MPRLLYVEEFWSSFRHVIVEAWVNDKPVIVVNAASVDNRPPWIQDLPGSSVEENLRPLALKGIHQDILIGRSPPDAGSEESSVLFDINNSNIADDDSASKTR